MADTTSNLDAKRLTRAALFGIECRLAKVYGCSPLASKIWLKFTAALGKRCPMVEATLVRRVAEGCQPLANLHGEPCSASYYERRKLTYGERIVREAVAREARGENWMMSQRQAS